MYRLGDIYERLDTGAPGALRTGAFAGPGAGPGSTGHTLNEVMGKAPALDNAAGAAAAEVPLGKTFWGLKAGAWGQQTGTMPNIGAQSITPSAAAQAISAGYHDRTGSVAGDADLAPGNIVSGVQIFGVTGTTAPASGNAAASQVLTSRTFSNAAGAATGTMPNIGAQAITPGVAAQTISAGYHNGSGSVAGAADLAAGNIRSGVNLFGVAGDSNVVNTSTGDATAANLLSPRKAWVDGVEVTGTMPTQTLSATSTTVSAGYYAATTLNAVEADLAAGNIVSGVQIFGVTGTAASGVTVGVPKTGQTTCYADSGAVISCTGTGQDGDLQKGVVWPNPRFTDNSNGTVKDNLTSLIWLKNANCFSTKTWAQALTSANALANGQCTLADGSTAGQWRLPNVKELQSLINFGTYGPALPSGHPFSGVQTNFYWSSTTYAGGTTEAWIVYLNGGSVSSNFKLNRNTVWPVRGEQTIGPLVL